MALMSLEEFVDVDGCFNVRDLGGYRTTDGWQIRSRTVYRADALHRATPRGAKALEDLGINTVMDLRTPAEVKRLRWEEATRKCDPLSARATAGHRS